MRKVNIREAKTTLSRLIEVAEGGEDMLIEIDARRAYPRDDLLSHGLRVEVEGTGVTTVDRRGEMHQLLPLRVDAVEIQIGAAKSVQP
ncbi:MAG: hypothetical protein WBO04_08795 [Steroidobacteraceae bacterium]